MKKQLQEKIYAFIVTTMIFIASANAQNVNIPDALFKGKLVNNPSINTNGDGEIQVSEAAAFNGSIDVSTTWPGPYISDLTGIEAFTAITDLDCSGNHLSSLDVSFNTALTSLNCRINPLTNLDVSANTAITSLVCQYNLLTSLNISTNSVLTTLLCTNNALTSLDVSANTALTVLSCGNNALTSLDVSANPALTGLSCFNNQIASLDVSTNTILTSLNCANNLITSLDLSANTALTGFSCGNNQLTSLNVQNGNNVNFVNFQATGNPNLTCIQVDNVAYSIANWSAYKDAGASFSSNCGVTSVPALGNLSTIQIFPNPANNHLTIVLGSNNKNAEVTITDISGKIIYSTSANGIQDIDVNTSEFAAGIYMAQIQTADFIRTNKLVIQN